MIVRKILGLREYHFGVLAIYAILCPLIFTFYSDRLSYNFIWGNLGLPTVATLGSLLAFYLLNRVFGWCKFKWQRLTLLQIFATLLYALLFAFPEELIFRGIIQTFLQTYLENTVVVVILSGLIFGLAHLPNGSHELHPSKWNWQFAIVTFVGVLLFAYIFALTRSLLIPTILHGLFLAFFRFYIKGK